MLAEEYLLNIQRHTNRVLNTMLTNNLLFHTSVFQQKKKNAVIQNFTFKTIENKFSGNRNHSNLHNRNKSKFCSATCIKLTRVIFLWIILLNLQDNVEL